MLSLTPWARRDASARFVLCGLLFFVLMSCAYGRISRDSTLFAFMGLAVGVGETVRARLTSYVMNGPTEQLGV
jgi:hypothetical protein